MSPSMQLSALDNPPYTPTSDAMDRHDCGVSKARKLVSTGGGRAWSEDEEVYLLQTRLQKMPYKHIAAHLKKTELACRLHYHQLSHGSNRRKRTASVSSGSSNSHSPILATTMPSPIRESSSRETTPGSNGSYSLSPDRAIQLPSIQAMNGANISPHLPAILPKPTSITLPPATSISASVGRVTTPPTVTRAHAPSSFVPSHTGHGPALRLDCSLPPPTTYVQVDMYRLQCIYEAHRTAFWDIVAKDYGAGVSPVVLEQAWKAHLGSPDNHNNNNNTPITPTATPCEREARGSFCEKQDKTSISAILDVDANPRSPSDREMVRRLEEETNIGVRAST